MTEAQVLEKLNVFKDAILTLKNKNEAQAKRIAELESLISTKDAELAKPAEFSDNVTNIINDIEGLIV